MPDANGYNIDEVVEWLTRFLQSFNFSLPGKDRNLGRDLAHVVAGQIAARSANLGRGADPEEWLRNEPVYAALKAETYGWPEDKPNYRTGQMLSHASLFGRTRVQDQLVEMIYGLDEAPTSIYSPEDNRTPAQREADESVRDVQKAEWNSAARPFYEIDDEIERAVIEAADEALNTYIIDVG